MPGRAGDHHRRRRRHPGDGTIAGTAGNDIIVGTEGDDVIAADGGDDRVCGMGGADKITGGDGFDRANGGPGEDACDAERTVNCEGEATAPAPPSDPVVGHDLLHDARPPHRVGRSGWAAGRGPSASSRERVRLERWSRLIAWNPGEIMSGLTALSGYVTTVSVDFRAGSAYAQE